MPVDERMILVPTGVTLDVTIVTPSASQEDGIRLAVFAHPWSMLGGRKEDPVLHRLVTPFLQQGYRVVVFNSRGVGKSTNWPSFSSMSEAEDLKALINVLVADIAASSGKAVTSVVLLGYSHGSIAVSHHPTSVEVASESIIPVRHILLSYPLSPMPFLTAFYHNTHADKLKALIYDTNSRVMILYGDHDQFTAEAKYDVWTAMLKDCSKGNLNVVKIPGADHFWHGQAARNLHDAVSAWLEEN